MSIYGTVARMRRNGVHPAKIARNVGLSRAEVEDIIAKLPARRRRIAWTIVALTLLAAALLFSASRGAKPQVAQPAAREATPSATRNFEELTHAAVQAYLSGRAKDSWYLSESQVESRDPKVLGPIASTIERNLEGMLQRQAGIPLVDSIRAEFGGMFYATFFSRLLTGDSTVQIQRYDRAGREVSPPRESRLSVVAFAHGHHELPMFKNVATLYRGGIQQLVLAGVEFSMEYFDALAAHELSHALHDRRYGTYNEPWSDAYFAEEVAAHGVGRAVLVRSTRGAYTARITAIVERHTVATLPELAAAITEQDLRWLDELFQPAGELEAGMRCSQYSIDICTLWANQHGISSLDATKFVLRRV